MRAIPLTVAALAAALVLTGCDSGGGGSKSHGSGCELDTVGLQVGPASAAPAAGDTGEVTVSLTNQSAKCTLDGFPSVTLIAGGTSAKMSSQQGAKAQKLTLAKGESATFTISYVRGKDGDSAALQAKSMKIGLPGSTDTRTYPWTYGPVAGKGGATTPNASVSAFTQAGD
ncbi:DUF4232 domain-containing protein [Streptomyces mangrovisoli]|uniref:DUF4232 domain-containing protein n=1 Tax=Streptomyces mangrovisoli TaxID=1428628 RepID=A0A1J4NX64_9ACTN|nr:DUF4232 domain-containing protein [Streptomyces mangrovisoli]OIJ65821.1 hypothetical protein WN71_021460 [Streptomyces mangrovisoli]